MIGFYNYTVIVTYISLLTSSLGVAFAMARRPFEALFCLMVSGVCDMFDGMIARTRKKSTDEERRFGIQLDSLTDIVCFGVLPAAIGMCIAPRPGLVWKVSCALGGLLVLCALIRLAYFNVTEETRQTTENGVRTHFMGLPVTTSALIFPLIFVLAIIVPVSIGVWMYPAALALTAICFILPIRVPKVRGVGLVIFGLIGLAEFGGLLYLMLS